MVSLACSPFKARQWSAQRWSHVRRTVACRHPVAFGGAPLAGAFLLTWSAATTSYILFHDDACGC